MENNKQENVFGEQISSHYDSKSADKLIDIYGLRAFPVFFHDNGTPAFVEVIESNANKNLNGVYVYVNKDGIPDTRYGYVLPTKFNEYGFLAANLSGVLSNRDKILLAKSTGAMCKSSSGEKEFEALVEMAIFCYNNPINLKYLLPTLAISDQSALNFMMTIVADSIETQTKNRLKESENNFSGQKQNFFVEYFMCKGNWFKVEDYIDTLNTKLDEIKSSMPKNIFVYSERLPLSLKIIMQADYLNKLTAKYYEIYEQFLKLKSDWEKLEATKINGNFDLIELSKLCDAVNDYGNGIVAETQRLLGDFNYLNKKNNENLTNLPKIKTEIDFMVSELEPFVGGGLGWYTAALENKTIIDDAGNFEEGVSENIKKKLRQTSMEVVDDLADWQNINEAKQKYLSSRATATKENANLFIKWCERLIEQEKELSYKIELASAYNKSGKVVNGLRDGSLINNFLFGKKQRGEE